MLTPWEVLLREAHQGEKFKTRTKEHLPADTFWLGLCILTGDDLLLTPINDIVEIVPVPKLASIPHVKHWLRGLALCRGEIIAITDLSELLKNKPTRITKHARILILPLGDYYCGLLVDKVLGLHRMLGKEIQPIGREEYPDIRSYLQGKYVNKKTELPIISLKSITNHSRFNNAKAIAGEIE